MTLDDMEHELNNSNREPVVQALSKWHPAILGQLLMAVADAKTRRCLGRHYGYERGLQYATQRYFGGKSHDQT